MSTPSPSRRLRTLRILLLLVGLLAAVLAFLPLLLSSAPARRLILSQVSRQTGLQVHAEGLGLSWISGMEIRGLHVTGTSIFTARVESVTVEKGLLSVLRDRNAGLVSITRPDITLSPSSARTRAPGTAVTGTVKTGLPASQKEAATPARFNWPPWSASLRVLDGVLILPAGPTGPQERIEDVTVNASLTPRPPRLDLKAAARNSSTGGKLDLRILATATKDQGLRPDDIRHESVLDCAGIQIQPLLQLLPSLSRDVARSGGQAGATLRIRGGGLANVTVQGVADIEDLQIRGLFPAGDEPLVSRLHLEVQGAVTNGIPTNLNVNVKAPFLRLQANQDPRVAGIGDRLNLIAALDLPTLATLLPRTLRMRPDVVLDSGSLQLRGQLELGTNMQFRLLAQLPELKGRMGSTLLALDEPASIEADVRWGADGLDLKTVRVRSGFANLEASGRPGRLSATGSLDLAKAAAQAGSFLELGRRTMGGVIAFSVGTTWMDDQSLGGVSMRADARDFSLVVPDSMAVRDEDVTLEVSASRGLHPDWSASALSLTASNRNVTVAAGGNGFDLRNFPGGAPRITVTGRANLGGVAAWIPGSPPVEGTLVLAPVQASLTNRVWQTSRLRMLFGGLVLPVGGSRLPLRDLDAETAAEWDDPGGQLRLRQLSVLSGGLRLAVPRLLIPLSPFRPAGIEGSLTFDAELARLLELIRPLLSSFPVRSAAGSLRLLASASEGLFSAAVNVGGLRLDLPMLARPLSEPAFSSRATFALSPGGGWRADAFEMTSSSLGLVGSAVLAPRNGGSFLDVSGDLTYDLAPLLTLVPGTKDTGLELSGRDSRSFRVGVPIGAPVKPGEPSPAYFDLDLTADRLKWSDLVLEDLRLPASLAGGRLSVNASARLGPSLLALHPRVRMGTPPRLEWESIPPVLDRLPLTDALAAQLLSHLHPLFQNASGLRGRASLHLDSVGVPLDKTWPAAATFKGRLALEEASLSANGWLNDVLDLAKVRERTVEIGTQTISFSCARGRISTSPVQVTVGRLGLTMAGSTGLDRTLDYTVTLPLSEELVGRKALEYLPGKTLNIPVGGTLEKPRIDRDLFRRELERLARSAAGKALESETDDLLRKLLEKGLK